MPLVVVETDRIRHSKYVVKVTQSPRFFGLRLQHRPGILVQDFLGTLFTFDTMQTSAFGRVLGRLTQLVQAADRVAFHVLSLIVTRQQTPGQLATPVPNGY